MSESLKSLREEIIKCVRCPRLVQHREDVAVRKRAAFRDWDYWGKPVPGFGDHSARLLIIGLAPAAHGGNRTGRIFTGDSSGAFLMQGLYRAGFANQPSSVSADDGLALHDAYITAIIRCAPPDNKPLPGEILNCRPFLLREIALLKNVKAVLALGKIAMDGYVQVVSTKHGKIPRPAFKHGGDYELPGKLPHLFVSYHPSQQNTQTGRLTSAMFDQVLGRICEFLQ